MPKKDNQFTDAVKPALESLLTDLQRTTEVLRRKHDPQRRNSTEADFDNFNEPPLLKGTFSKSAQSKRSDLSSPSSVRRDTSMLSSPAIDLDKHGIHTIPKGDCASCDKPVIGQVVIALGKMWHPEHFSCYQCGGEIGHRKFFEKAGKAYCENDYHDLFSPRCCYCNGPVRERYINALGKCFHPEHFTCAHCGKPLDEGFHEKDGSAYCKEDFFRIYAPKCHGCKQPITHKFVTALDTHWHPECFCCQECARPFDYNPYFYRNGLAFCELCYHRKSGSLCFECQGPITGRCVSALGKRFHPEHFCCAYCNGRIIRGLFREIGGRPFCQTCFEKRLT